jgi:hypothetical protein
MASPIEIIGAVTTCVELAQVTQKCLTVLNDIRRGAPMASSERQDMRFLLQVQAIVFERWCTAVSIPEIIKLMDENPQGWRDTKSFEAFQHRITLELRLNHEGIASLTLHTISTLSNRFQAAWEVLQVDEPYSLIPKAASPNPATAKSSSKLRNIFKRGPASNTSTGLTSQPPSTADNSSISLVSQVRWPFDKKSFMTLLDEIQRFNDSLKALLQVELQIQVNRRADMEILEDSIPKDYAISTVLPDHRGLKTLVGVKKWQEEENNLDEQSQPTLHTLDESTPQTSIKSSATSSKLHIYPIEEFAANSFKDFEARSIAMLGNEQVLVEWKYYSQKTWSSERKERLASLAGLLNRDGAFEKFLVPYCQGLVSDSANLRIGIIFNISAHGSGDPRTGAKRLSRSLQDIIGDTSSTVPALGERFQLAKALALALHHLHSVNWLHKSIRSDNIISFVESQNGHVDTYSSGVPLKSLPAFYLLGWDLSRPDKPSEKSETISISTAGFQANRLYSHPDVSVPNKSTPSSTWKRQRYHPRYDIYSLGLILLEIGLWRTVKSMRSSCATDDEFIEKVKTDYCNRLPSKTGVLYWKVTQRCLQLSFDSSEGEKGSLDGFALKILFEKQVICELEKCNA